jgi:mannose-6-phosphate isomerase
MEEIYPLTFEPVFRNYLWGGRNLETMLGRSLPPGKIAESWEISGHPSSPTPVSNGPLAGQTLPEVLNRLGTELVGKRSQAMLARGKFPLLVKLLDANEPLSVQVHPNDEYAQTHEDGELGKTEMWYVLHAAEGAHLIYGLQAGVTRESFRQALEAGRLEECLHYLPVQAGDAIFIPSGSVHAILEGIVVTEIQQNSDTTYRVYDWNRVDADGKPRSLHIDKALDVINFAQVEPGPYQPHLLAEDDTLRHEIITASAYFVVERLTFKRAGSVFEGKNDGSTLEIWGSMSGQIRITWTGEPLNLTAVRYVLLPAALGEFQIEAVAPSVCLRVYVPER